ncbi:MAG: hypothetical protein C0609_04300 [Deltaproteobacteria bacterium]|nr:MAG: hypothetical protein C0609_04300 [Deltaproteobacteria bacterium]
MTQPTPDSRSLLSILEGFSALAGNSPLPLNRAFARLHLELGIKASRLTKTEHGAPGPLLFEAGWSGLKGDEEILSLPCNSAEMERGTLEVAATSFATDARVFLEAVSSRIGIELDNRRLREELTEARFESEAIQSFSRELTWSRDIKTLCDVVLKEALNLVQADGGALYLGEPKDEHIYLRATAGELYAPLPDTVLPDKDGSFIANAALGERPLRNALNEIVRGEKTGPAVSRIAVPFKSTGGVLGVLTLEAAAKSTFDISQERVLSVFAAQASKALEVAILIGDLRLERDTRENILAGSPNGIIAVNELREVTLMNSAAREYLSLREEPLGNPIERYIPLKKPLALLDRVMSDHSQLEAVELPILRNGETRYYYTTISSLGRSSTPGATLIIQDVTEKRKLDARMQFMERVASIGHLAAGIAHEIRNPLTGIGITLDNLVAEENISDGGRELIRDILKEVERLEHLIRELLDFARPQPAKIQPMELSTAFEWSRAFTKQCRKKGIECEVEMEDNPTIIGDPEKLKQLFLNLAINALEATAPGGRISIRSYSKGSQSGRVTVEIKDTGAGIDEKTQSQIFTPFFTTKNEGTGLGLSIVHSICEQHGGEVEIESTPGVGTAFMVNLPLTGVGEPPKEI